MAKAPVVTELPLQNIRFLFGTMVDLRMLPQVLEQTGRAEVGEFKLVAHFPADEKAANNEAGYMARHKGFRGGDYNTYHGDPYTLDEINWDATGRAGVHLVTKTKYGQQVEFPTIPDKSDPSELMLIVSEYVESIKTPPLIVRCSGIGGSISPLGNKKYQLSLTTGATKCPAGIKDHVPKQYHAEDSEMIPHVGGDYLLNAESMSPADRDFIGQQIARQMQGYYRTGVIGVDPVIGAYPNGPMSIAKRTNEAKQDFFREPAVQDEDGRWNKGPNRWQAHKIAKGVAYDQLERAKRRGTMLSAEDYAAERKLMCAECDDYFAGEHGGCGCGTKSMKAESNFDKLAHKISMQYQDKGRSKQEADEIGRRTAYKIGAKKYGKRGMTRKAMAGRRGKSAEYFAAASTAAPNLNREKANLRSAIRAEIDPNFEYSQCIWGPYAVRQEGPNTNKFYIVFVYDNGNGVFRALGGYGGLAQNPRLFDVMTTRDQAAAVAAATKKLKAKERKGYFTYRAEEFNAPYVGAGALMDIGKDTGLGSFTMDELTTSSAIHGDFDHASLNYSGHQNLQSRAENFNAYSDPISSRQVWKIGQLGGTVKKNMDRSQASDYIKDLLGKPSGTWRAEEVWDAEELYLEAMARIDPKKATDVADVKNALRQRYKGIRINRTEYITNRKGTSNKYHVFAFTNRGVFNGYGRIGKTMTIFGPMSEAEGMKKLNRKLRQGYKEQV